MRFDTITPGSIVELRLDGNMDKTEQAVFVGIIGEGEDRHAEFISPTSNLTMFKWGAYRMNKRWCYGTSAGRISVVKVIDEGYWSK